MVRVSAGVTGLCLEHDCSSQSFFILGMREHFNRILMVFLRIRSGSGRKISLRSVRSWKEQIDSDKLMGLATILERRGRGLEGTSAACV